MLTLNDGRAELWQWDTGRTLAVDADCSQVHFSNKVFGRSIDVDVAGGVAIIPDILLQTDKDLNVWAFVGTAENGYTKISKTFKVNRRNKPADYVFTPPDQTSLEEIREKIDYLESIQDPDAIKNAVADYISKNPITVEETDPTVPAWAKASQKPSYTASEVGADPSGTAASKVSAHNIGTDTHSDIRLLIQGLTDRLNALADSDDTTLDQLSEVVSYIKSNRSLIEAITTSKVSVADIVDNLTTNVANKPLSAAQGVALKALIDAISVPDKLPNPNALTFTGAVTGSYDGSEPLTVEIPSSGGGSGGSGKAKTQKLIDITFTEPTASLTVTLEHSFHKLFLVWSCGSNGVSRLVDVDGNAVSGNIRILLDTTSYSWSERIIGQLGVDKTEWQTSAHLIKYTADLSTLLSSISIAIKTGTAGSIANQFGGTSAMIGTIGGNAPAPTVGRTVNIVTSGGFFAATTRIVLVGEYYE